MAVESRQSWPAAIEDAIRTLRDVEAASVLAEGADIREIHVLTGSDRPAKQIVRDIQTLLMTRFARPIDFRVVSVAYTRAPSAAAVAPIPIVEHAAPHVATPPAANPQAEPARETRIRFGSVNLYVSGPRAQAQVELRWKGVTRTGTATGSAARDSAHQLVAEAAVRAIEEFLEDEWALGVAGVEVVRLGRREVATVALTLLAHRQEKTLVGSCTVEQDVAQAVALATLAALNRVVGGLETRDPTEYVLRPTSTQEASEAK